MGPVDFDPDFATPADWARLYRNCGLQVVPAVRKQPAINWRKLQNALVDDATFDSWYGPQGRYANSPDMGFITGTVSGNVFVVDLDDHKNKAAAAWWQNLLHQHNFSDEPHTWQHRTGGGGRHLLFRAPPGYRVPTFQASDIGVDFRGEGGFAMLPPSRHFSGHPYRWLERYEPWEAEIADGPH
jgi:hypothetical protein